MTTWNARSCPAGPFTGPADFNAQLAGWLAVANTRPKRVLGCAPAERITADKAAMLALPPVPRRPGGGTRCGWPVTITSGWTPTTTPSTRR